MRRLPDYAGPLLDFDLSALGDWESSEKVRGMGKRACNVCIYNVHVYVHVVICMVLLVSMFVRVHVHCIYFSVNQNACKFDVDPALFKRNATENMPTHVLCDMYKLSICLCRAHI